MLSYSASSSSELNHNLCINDYYGTNRSNINNYCLTSLIKDEKYEELFGCDDPFFNSFITEYSHAKEYEKTDVLNEPYTPVSENLEKSYNGLISFTDDTRSSVDLNENLKHSAYEPTLNRVQFNTQNFSYDIQSSVRENFVNLYENSFQNEITHFLDSDSVDSLDPIDQTILADQHEEPRQSFYLKTTNLIKSSLSPKRKELPKKKYSPRKYQVSAIKENTSPRKGNKYKYSHRHRFKEYQLEILEKEFQLERYPSGEDIDRISSQLKVNHHTVAVWFQNRRARLKRSNE